MEILIKVVPDVFDLRGSSARDRVKCRSFRAMMWFSNSRRQLPTQRYLIPFCQGF